MLFLSTIQRFGCDGSVFLSTTFLLSLITTSVVVEAQQTTNGVHWPVQYQEAAGGLRSEQDIDDRHSQLTSDNRNEQKHESTGSGFVANALAAGVGTLLANGISDYGNYGWPYTSGAGFNNMAGAYGPGSYVSAAGPYTPVVGVYIPSVYLPGSYTPGSNIPGSYVEGAIAYIAMNNAPNYGVISTGYRPPQPLPIYGDRDVSDSPDASTDLADFANSYPGYYSDLESGNTSPKKEGEANVAASALLVDTDGDSSVAEQQDIRTAGSSVQFPIDWSAVAHDYYRSLGLDSSSRQPEAESEDVASVNDHSYPFDFEESSQQ